MRRERARESGEEGNSMNTVEGSGEEERRGGEGGRAGKGGIFSIGNEAEDFTLNEPGERRTERI